MKASTANNFIILESKHRSQARLSAITVKDLFHQALEAMASIIYKPYRSLTPHVTVHIKVSSVDINSLIVDFLSEALWQGEVHKAVFPEMRERRFTNSELEADLIGIPIRAADTNISSVSYSGMRVSRRADGLWQTEVQFEHSS